MPKEKPIRLYVGCAITGAPRGYLAYIKAVKEQLRRSTKPSFEVLDFILPGEDHLGLPTKGFSPAEGDIFKNDIEKCIATCDLFVAFADRSSSGLGLELGATLWKTPKPILIMAQEDAKASGLILDTAVIYPKQVQVRRYPRNLPADVVAIVCEHCRNLGLVG